MGDDETKAKLVTGLDDVEILSSDSTMSIILATPTYFAQCVGFMIARSALLEFFFTPLKEMADEDKKEYADPAVHGLLGAAAQMLGLVGVYISEGSNPVQRVWQDSIQYGWWVFAIGGMWQYLQTLGENLAFLSKDFDSATVVNALGALIIPMVFLVNLITKLQSFSLLQFFGVCLTTIGGLAAPLTLIDVEEEKLAHQLRNARPKMNADTFRGHFYDYLDPEEHNKISLAVDPQFSETTGDKSLLELARPAIGLAIALAGYGFQSVWQRQFGCLRSEEGHVQSCSTPSCYCALTGVWQLLYSTVYCFTAKYLGIVDDSWSFTETVKVIYEDEKQHGLTVWSLMSAIGQFCGQQGLAMATYYYGALMSEILYQLGAFPIQIFQIYQDGKEDYWIDVASMVAIAWGGFLYITG